MIAKARWETRGKAYWLEIHQYASGHYYYQTPSGEGPLGIDAEGYALILPFESVVELAERLIAARNRFAGAKLHRVI